jgi:putative ABC transport system permease protein
MSAILERAVGNRQSTMFVLAAFAAVALALAIVGLYGVIAYTVTQRHHEIGTRRALGATEHDILTMILKQGLRLILAGTAIGIVAAFSLTGLLKGLIFEVSANDPSTYVAVAILLAAVAAAASYIPARRASRIDPVTVLRAV